MKMLYHYVVLLEIVFGLVNFVEPKFTVLYTVFWVDFLYFYLYA